jgi:hypothetical protein
MTNVETEIRGELFTHRLLWACCLELAEAAKEAVQSGKDSFCFKLSSMLMAFLTCESYINFLGDRLAPDAWKNERNFFNQPAYKGLEGKLKKLCEICNICDIQTHKGKRPYQTIKELSRLRTYLSHGKPDKYEKLVLHPRGKDPDLFYPKIYQMVSEKTLTLDTAIHDVEEFIRCLNVRARRAGNKRLLDKDALEGFMQHSTSETRNKLSMT